MTRKKSKRHQKKREEKFFTVGKVFPPSDLVGLDILRLMAAYNDIGRIIDWMRAEPDRQSNEQSKKISNARRSMLIRMAIGFLHEALEVVKQMQQLPDFPRLETLLDKDGKKALQTLQNENSRFHESILSLMARVRSKATFHYVREEFKDAIKEFKAKRGDDIQSSFIFEHIPPKIRAYYLLADHLRDAAGFGIVSPGEARKIIEAVVAIQGDLIIFLGSAMLVYGKDRGLQDKFKLSPD